MDRANGIVKLGDPIHRALKDALNHNDWDHFAKAVDASGYTMQDIARDPVVTEMVFNATWKGERAEFLKKIVPYGFTLNQKCGDERKTKLCLLFVHSPPSFLRFYETGGKNTLDVNDPIHLSGFSIPGLEIHPDKGILYNLVLAKENSGRVHDFSNAFAISEWEELLKAGADLNKIYPDGNAAVHYLASMIADSEENRGKADRYQIGEYVRILLSLAAEGKIPEKPDLDKPNAQGKSFMDIVAPYLEKTKPSDAIAHIAEYRKFGRLRSIEERSDEGFDALLAGMDDNNPTPPGAGPNFAARETQKIPKNDGALPKRS